jgi:hypothetical protein
MLDLNFWLEFSQTHCISICALLVPANLLATLQTLLLVGFSSSGDRIRLMAGFASIYAILLILHVIAWWAIGVVMAPTFILSALGLVCISLNLWAVMLSRKRDDWVKVCG